MTMSLNLISTVLLYLFISESVSLVAGVNLVYGNSFNIFCGSNDENTRWYHNGVETEQTGWVYKFPNVTFADEGQYECRVGSSPEGSRTVDVYADLKPLFRTCDSRNGSQCERTVTQGQTVQVCVDYSTIPATLGLHEIIPLGYRYWTININGNKRYYTCNSSVCWLYSQNNMQDTIEYANSTCYLIRNVQEDTTCSFVASTQQQPPQSFGTRHSVQEAVVRLKVRGSGADSSVLGSSPSSTVVPTSSDMVSSNDTIQTPTQDSPGSVKSLIAGGVVAAILFCIIIVIVVMVTISATVIFLRRRTCKTREIYAKIRRFRNPEVFSLSKSGNDLGNAPSKARPDKLLTHSFLTPHGNSKGTPTQAQPLICLDPTMSSGEGETPVLSSRLSIREPPPDYSSLLTPASPAQNVKSPEGLSIFMGSPSISGIDFEREEVLDSDFSGEPLGNIIEI